MKGGESRLDNEGENPRPDPTRRSRGGRRHSGAPGGGVPARHAHRKVQLRRSANRRSAPSRMRGKRKEEAPAPRLANKGADESRLYECACLHAGCLTIESEMSARWCRGSSPSPGGGGSRAKRAGWGDLLAKMKASPHPDCLRFAPAVDPPPPGEGGNRPCR